MYPNIEHNFKIRLTKRTAWFLALGLLMIILAVILNIKFNRDLNDRKVVCRNVQEVVRDKEQKMDRLLNLIFREHLTGNGEMLDSVTGENLFEKWGMVLFVAHADSLTFWSDNSVPYEKNWSSKENGEEFIRLKDGWYILKTKREGVEVASGVILVKKEYPYQNLYLKNTFQKDFKLSPSTGISMSQDKNNIMDPDGKFLFSLEFNETYKMSGQQAMLLFLFCMVGLLFILAAIYSVYTAIPFFYSRKLLMLSAFAVDVILLRVIIRIFEIPRFLYTSGLFSPYYFATSWFEPSLGDLLVNRIMLLVIAYAFFIQYKFSYGRLKNLNRYSVHLFQWLVVVALYFLSFISYKSLVDDSSLMLNLTDISDIDVYSLLGFTSITATLLSYFFISAALLRNIWINSVSEKEYLVSAGVSIIVVLIVFATVLRIPCNWPVCLIFGIYVLSFDYFLRKRGNIRQLPAIVFFMILFAIASTFMLNRLNNLKELQNRRMIATTLTTKRNPLVEYEFMKTEDKIGKDSLINKYFEEQDTNEENEQDIAVYLKDKYFTHFWNKFEIQITACDTDEILNIQPGDYLINCNEYFSNLIRDYGIRTILNDLYYIDNQTENNNYIAVLTSDSLGNFPDKKIYIEVYYKYMTETGLGYPELLIDKEIDVSSKISGYSYARYYHHKLTYKYGDYFYHLDFTPYMRADSTNYFLDMDGYSHYVVKTNEDNFLILSKKNPSFFDVVAPFSYLFLFFSVFLLLFVAILILAGEYKRIETNFRNRFQIAIITIIMISLIVLGFITRAYIIGLNNKKNTGYLTEKTYSILVELEHKIGNYDSIPPSEANYVSDLLYKFAQVFFTDINLYQVNGDLIASSRPQIFEESLLSDKMNRIAYNKLVYGKNLLYIHDEQIGKQVYLSAYIPFRNTSDKIIAYLNLPYFAKQDEMREEIADFLSAYINIYVLLIVLAILITVLVSRYVTRPLQLIREKLQNLSYGRSTEKIEWKREDEIGELVAEYNRTLDELARSAEKLARSERETAWREMAKQVAHEIKNPLTPMKLSVQYLKKAWDEKAADWEERLNRFSNTIIEQIESLSRIATEFSDFAKMPVASFEKIDLLKTIQRSADLYADSENIIISIIAGEGEYFISADRQQMLRVFNNLINNSIQAIGKKKEGKIDIRLSIKGRNYVVEVTDNGSGMTAEQAERIFSPSFTTKSSGMGLGLAMVKNIISGIGATISFTSKEGEGTTFVLEIPKFIEN